QGVCERLGGARLGLALDESLEGLAAAGVRAAALKGPVLGERLYPDPAARPSTDLDFLVLPDDLERAAAALQAIGYQAQTGPAARYHRRHHRHICLYRPGSPTIELHFRAYTG